MKWEPCHAGTGSRRCGSLEVMRSGRGRFGNARCAGGVATRGRDTDAAAICLAAAAVGNAEVAVRVSRLPVSVQRAVHRGERGYLAVPDPVDGAHGELRAGLDGRHLSAQRGHCHPVVRAPGTCASTSRRRRACTTSTTGAGSAPATAKFLFGNQTRDNVFWTLVSGCGVWSLFEALTMWMYANGHLPYVDFRTNPVYFVLLLAAVGLLREVHFYWVHRLIHWKPLYKAAHYLHHKNVNIGPWAGLSMHPIEHLIYFTGVFLQLDHPVASAARHHAPDAPGAVAGAGARRLRRGGNSARTARRCGTPTTSTTCITVTSNATTAVTGRCRSTAGSAASTTAPKKPTAGCANARTPGCAAGPVTRPLSSGARRAQRRAVDRCGMSTLHYVLRPDYAKTMGPG